jgi:hypothetical protein
VVVFDTSYTGRARDCPMAEVVVTVIIPRAMTNPDSFVFVMRFVLTVAVIRLRV